MPYGDAAVCLKNVSAYPVPRPRLGFGQRERLEPGVRRRAETIERVEHRLARPAGGPRVARRDCGAHRRGRRGPVLHGGGRLRRERLEGWHRRCREEGRPRLHVLELAAEDRLLELRRRGAAEVELLLRVLGGRPLRAVDRHGDRVDERVELHVGGGGPGERLGNGVFESELLRGGARPLRPEGREGGDVLRRVGIALDPGDGEAPVGAQNVEGQIVVEGEDACHRKTVADGLRLRQRRGQAREGAVQVREITEGFATAGNLSFRKAKV